MKLGSGFLAVGGVLSALVAGCGGSNSSSGPSTQACADVALARCSEGSECSLPEMTTGTGFNILENYGSLQTCLTRQALACMDGLAAPGTGNSPAKVESCAAELESGSTCQDFFDNQPPTDCAVTGSRPNGGSCTFNGQCTSGYCQGTKTSVCGTCADVPTVGSDCSDSTCAPGQRCIASTLQCQNLLQLNATTCDTAHPCDRGLVCVGNDAATNTLGTCETAGTVIGQACGGTMPACDGTLGLYCGGPAGAKTCMLVIYPGATYGSDGGADAASTGAGGTDAGTGAGACGVLADGTHRGCVAGGCYTATGPATGTDLGTCVPFAPDNMPCNSVVGPDCMPPARCVASGAGTSDAGAAGTCLVPSASMCPSS